MPSPFKTQVAAKIWALLNNRTELSALVMAGSKQRQNLAGTLSEIIRRSPAEFPQVKLTNGRFTHSGFAVPAPTYAMEHTTFIADGGDWDVRRTLVFQLTITGRDTDADKIDPAEEEAQTALLFGGPRMSEGAGDPLGFVIGWGPLDAVQSQIDDNGFPRLRSVITIPVLLEHGGRELIT